jgi:histidinol-phosphate/aromatic aminotransferase/cobyric acid decarboxylase-like protein/choline kinase
MKAIILAAGIGSRLYPLTQNKPKALLEINGITLLDRMIGQLSEEGVQDFVVVSGYRSDAVEQELRNIAAKRPRLRLKVVENPVYRSTGTAYSLWLSLPHWGDDILIVEGDLVVEKELVEKLCASGSEAFLITDFQGRLGPEEMKLRVEEGAIREISKALDPAVSHGEYIGMGRFRGHLLEVFTRELDTLIVKGGKMEFYEAAMQAMAADHRIEAPSTDGRHWTEIDFLADYEKANAIFWEESKPVPVRTELFSQTSHSPSLQSLYQDFEALHVHDFCYLANPFFPTPKFMREIRMKLDLLLRAYPSLNRDIAEKIGVWTGINPERIVVGNGATELIDHLVRLYVSNLTLPIPTFSEYIETAEKHGKVLHTLRGDPENFFRVDPRRLADAARENGSNAVVLINPDNPSAQNLPVEVVRGLLEDLSDLDLVMVDESFSDFASVEPPPSAVNLCDQYPNLVVVKSLGKIFGLPGLRLGYVVTADRDRAEELRVQLPVWNQNSVAEFFLDRLPAYRKDYEISRVKVVALTQSLREALGGIPGLEAFPSATNFVLVRVTAGLTSTELRDELLSNHRIYVRDCLNKVGLGDRYVRIACRTEPENEHLLNKLREVLAPHAAAAHR